MKKSHAPFDDVWTFAAPDAGNGAALAAHDTLVIDDGDPFPLAADTVTTVVTSAAKPVASIATLADYLVNGYWQYANSSAHHWASYTITYNIRGLNSAEKFLALSALQAWSDVANITFIQTSGSANITFTHNGTMQAYTSGSWSGASLSSATVNISSDWITNDGGAYDGKTGIDSYGYQTYIHEIGHALGLGHQGPYNGSASYSTNAVYANDTWQYSIMSYFAENNYSGSSYRYVVTPQLADIYAVASIYGAATSTRTGDTVYGFHSNAGAVFDFSSYSQAPALTIYDSGGNDTLDCSGYSAAQTIDLHPGAFSSVGGLVHNIGIALNTTVENAIGGSGNDTLIANDSGCTLTGGAGNDTLIGGTGNDRLVAGAGVDVLAGGGGADTFVFAVGDTAAATGQHDRITDFTSGADHVDLSAIDAISATAVHDAFHFIGLSGFDGVAGELDYSYNGALGVTVLQGDTNGDQIADFAIDLTGNITLGSNDLIGAVWASVAVKVPIANDLNYASTASGYNHFIDLLNFEASFPDLISAFGLNQAAMQSWYNVREPFEQRVATFDGLDYVASYPDLITAFASAGSMKAVQDAGATHFIQSGVHENRSTTFNGLDYIASYGDLLVAFGANGDAGAFHFIEYGYAEHRATTFDGLNYIASYADLIHAFGTNEQAGAAHFIGAGYYEHRTTTFDGLAYIAQYPDLMQAFGPNNDAGAAHYIDHGFTEGRSTSFDVAAYEQAHPDLIGAYATSDQFLTAYISYFVATGHYLI
jgi:Ca2+-binding RTX toxin-like protein